MREYILTKEMGIGLEISQESDLKQDFSKADIVKIKHCINSFDWMNELVRKELSQYLCATCKMFRANEHYYVNMFNDIDFRIASNEFFIYRMKNPLVEEFMKDGFYHFPLKSLRKILDKKKKESKKYEQNKNASAFSFDIFSSVIMEELRTLKFDPIVQNKSEWENNIKAEAPNLNVFISEVKLKSIIKKQQELDDTFPLELSINGKHGRSGNIWFRTTWGAIKELLPGLIKI